MWVRIPVCQDDRLSVVLGRELLGQDQECDMELELFTPSGTLVGRADPGVEAGHGPRHDFLHVELPFGGESKGIWKGRVMRSADSSRDCRTQRYFYSVLAKGLGRIDPFVVKPKVVVGQPLLATFRITESNRPIGGFDNVEARVTLTRPDGSQQTHKLFDDGTNGDTLARNNIWSAEIPEPPQEPGVYHFRGRFELGQGGCVKVRETEYSIVVERQPDVCTEVSRLSLDDRMSAAVSGPINAFSQNRVQPGDLLQVDELVCVVNHCASWDQYELEIRDSQGWLKTRGTGSEELLDLPSSFRSNTIPSFGEGCFGRGEELGNPAGGLSLLAAIPRDAKPGDRSDVFISVSSVISPNQKPIELQTSIEVFSPPDCNENGKDDRVDIGEGLLEDNDGDGIPDECQVQHPFSGLETVTAIVSAANFHPGGAVAPESIVSAFGQNLSDKTEVAMSFPLPTELAGTMVTVGDSTGKLRTAQLFFASPQQLNYLIPIGTATGPASVAIRNLEGHVSRTEVQIEKVSPGLFSANATGQGVAAALFLRVAADGSRTQDLIFDPNTLASVPIDLSPPGDQVFLLLFGTGIRGFTWEVTATIGAEDVPVLGAVPQGQFEGLDQVNIGPLPRSLIGRGEIDIVLTVDLLGRQRPMEPHNSNVVIVNIR